MSETYVDHAPAANESIGRVPDRKALLCVLKLNVMNNMLSSSSPLFYLLLVSNETTELSIVPSP